MLLLERKPLVRFRNVVFLLSLVLATGGATSNISTISPREAVQSRESLSLRRARSMRVISPLNDALVRTGAVLVVFETHGFAASARTPIEVRVPQNGVQPALLEEGNKLTLDIREPCTQLVQLDAIVGGQCVSTSVLFSTVLDATEISNRRFPLPSDAAWGAPTIRIYSQTVKHGNLARREVDHVATSVNNKHGNMGSKTRIVESAAAASGQDGSRTIRNPETSSQGSKGGHGRGMRDEAEVGRHDSEKEGSVSSTTKLTWQVDESTVKGPRAGDATQQGLQRSKKLLSLLFVGSLSFDGQKAIWLQQMEHLPRHRFSSTYMTFQNGDPSIEQPASSATTGGASHLGGVLEVRLQRSGVTLIKVPAPRLDVEDWGEIDHFVGSNRGSDNIHAKASQHPGLREAAFSAVLESLKKASGDPALMNPSWAQEMFYYIAQAVTQVSPDVLILGNAKTLGDAVLTQAARWAMGPHGRIVMDFPNINPAPGITADVLATPSHYVARHFTTETLAVMTGAQVVVIPPGVPNERESLVVGFVGRLAPEKGPALFLSVAKELSQLLPSVRFVVAGDGPLRTALEAMADRIGIARFVHFTGWASAQDVERLMRDFDLLFNPSLQASETFAIANVEAMAAGTPVASFGIGGMLEYLKPDVNALVLDRADDARVVAASLANLLLDSARLERMGARAQEDVLKYFRADKALERWATLYETLVNGDEKMISEN